MRIRDTVDTPEFEVSRIMVTMQMSHIKEYAVFTAIHFHNILGLAADRPNATVRQNKTR